jgi:hypothetical protein
MKKLGILLMAIILALGATGVGYAYWYHDIWVDAAVETGELSATFTGGNQTSHAWADGPNQVAWYTFTGADVDDQVLAVTIGNAYPGLHAVVPILLKNDGTIPIGQFQYYPDLETLPAGSSIVMPDLNLTANLAVNEVKSANIHVYIPLPAVPDNVTFKELNTTDYHFSILIRAIQFNPISF